MAQPVTRRGPRGPKGDQGDPGPPGGGYNVTSAEFEGDGSTTVFTLPDGAVPAGRERGTHLFIDGLARVYRTVPATSSEFKVSGATLTIGAAPATGALIYVTHEIAST